MGVQKQNPNDSQESGENKFFSDQITEITKDLSIYRSTLVIFILLTISCLVYCIFSGLKWESIISGVFLPIIYGIANIMKNLRVEVFHILNSKKINSEYNETFGLLQNKSIEIAKLSNEVDKTIKDTLLEQISEEMKSNRDCRQKNLDAIYSLKNKNFFKILGNDKKKENE